MEGEDEARSQTSECSFPAFICSWVSNDNSQQDKDNMTPRKLRERKAQGADEQFLSGLQILCHDFLSCEHLSLGSFLCISHFSTEH